MRTIEQGVTVFTSAEIRVALLPVGVVPQETLQSYCERIEKYRHVDLTAVKSFYHEKQKSPLKYLPWNEGALHFKFVQERAALQPTPLAALHACRAVLGVIGVCHCPNSPDISAAYAEFEKMAKQFPKAAALRCFAFQPQGDEQQDSKKNEHLIMFPPGDDQHIEQHVEVLMHDFAACILMELQHGMLRMKIGSMSLSTPIDHPDFSGHLGITDDASKRLGNEDEVKQRRRHTRLEKLLGDWCLLAGSPRDAREHYTTCVELAKLSGDIVWSAAALEGLAEAKVIEVLVAADSIPGSNDEELKPSSPDSPGSEVATPRSKILRFESAMGFGGVSLWRVIKRTDGLEQQVRNLYLEAGHVYQRRGILPLQIEVELKRVRFTAGLHGKAARAEVSDILTQVMDQWPLLKCEEDRVNVVVEAAQVLGLVGCYRKRALLIWQALEAVRNLQSSDRLLLNTSLKSLDPPGDHENQDKGEFRRMEWSLTNCGLPHSNWYLLHRAMLQALLPTASRAGSHAYVWEATSALLREHCAALSVENQMVLMEALRKASEELDSVSRSRPGPGPPPLFQVRGVSPLRPELRPILMTVASQNSESPFLFKPSARKQGGKEEEDKIQWVVGEECYLEVYVANPCAAQIKVDRLSLFAEMDDDDDVLDGPPFHKVPVTVVLPGKTKPTRVSLGIVPVAPGILRVLGVTVTLFGVTWLQTFTSSLRRVPLPPGSSLVESPWGQSHMNMMVAIQVVPPLPFLKVSIVKMDAEEATSPGSPPPSAPAKGESRPEPQTIVMYEGQHLNCKMVVRNPSKIPVTAAVVKCKHIDFSNRMPIVSMDISEHALADALPLAPETSVEVPVLISVEPCLKNPSTIAGQVVSMEVCIEYRGPQQEKAAENCLGREAKVLLNFKCLPAIGIKSVRLRDQYFLCGLASDSELHAGVQRADESLTDDILQKNASISNMVDQKTVETQNGHKGESNPSNNEAMGSAHLSCNCIIELDATNHMDHVTDVWLQLEAADIDNGGSDEVPTEASTQLQPGATTKMSCIVPPMDDDDMRHATVGHGLEQKVASWIHSNVKLMWKATKPSVVAPDPDTAYLNLEPETGISGAVTLPPTLVQKILPPRLLGTLVGCLVMVSVGVVKGSSRKYVDLRSFIPEQASVTLDVGLPARHWSIMSDDILKEECSTHSDGQEPSNDMEPYGSAADNGPRGPNQEIWGIESTIGEIIECELVAENGTPDNIRLCLSICAEELAPGVSFQGMDVIGPGILVLGKVGKVVLEVEKGKTERHRYAYHHRIQGHSGMERQMDR